MFLLQSSPDVTESVAYKLGYSIGYFVGNYQTEILVGCLLIFAFVVAMMVKRRRKKLQQEI